ncbi:ATP-binding protein [Nocardiopsis synnemataformans]|uniref:ATP-binding protein n=1 Tax=Nocardiopsis synnemataformans TaxID=61305 RepID=UPI003EBEAF41
MPPADLLPPPLPRMVRVTEPGVYVVEYGADQRLAAQVRRWVWAASRMSREQADSLIEVTHELYVNALKHTVSGIPGGWTRLTLTHSPTVVRIEVTDQGPLDKAGRVRMADGAEEAGNGLRLVDALSCEWGVAGGVDGHTVWAHLPRPRRRSERARVMFQAAS